MKDRGMVLITVLWIVTVIAFISLSLAAAVRVEMRATQDSFDSERAFFMAKGAAEIVFHELQTPDVLKGSPVRRLENNVYVVPFNSGEARVHFESNGALIDINEAPDKLLASMFESLRVDEPLRGQLVDSILDWRDADDVPLPEGAEIADYGEIIPGKRRLPSNEGFTTVDELLLVKNMTSRIFFGHIEFDEEGGNYRRTKGLRELVTVGSRRGSVNINEASSDVLAALPAMTPDLVARIVSERTLMPFEDVQDLARRVPELQYSESIEYMATTGVLPTGIVSVATVQPSGTSRTVRLDFLRERKKQILVVIPLIYKDIEVFKFGGWRY